MITHGNKFYLILIHKLVHYVLLQAWGQLHYNVTYYYYFVSFLLLIQAVRQMQMFEMM